MINHPRKSLLFNNQQAWIIKESRLFDVAMEAYDGAEVCELVDSFLRYQHSNKYNKKDIGFYQDDGLAVLKNKSGPQAERIKKDFQNVFRENDLNVVIKCNLKIVNYLDVTLNLNNTYTPFSKPNNEINYIHKESNHPLSIIKQVSFSIESHLSSLSSNEKTFNESTPIYQEELKKSGYDYKLKYQQNTSTANSTEKKIIWFNPPYSMNIAANVGRYFLNLINKHFPPHHKFSKIFNRNNMKISYSCMPNMKSRISTSNKKVTKAKRSAQARTCNCTNKSKCPLNNKYLSNNVLYRANITSTTENYRNKIYYGISETKFKL